MKVGELPGWLGGGTLAWQQDLEMKMKWGKKGGQEERDGKRDRRGGEEGEEREGVGKGRRGKGEERNGIGRRWGLGRSGWRRRRKKRGWGEKKNVGSKGKRGRKDKVPRKITKRARAPTPVSGLQKAREHACHSEVALEHIWTAVFRGGQVGSQVALSLGSRRC